MADYQNLFTAVQVTGPLHDGIAQHKPALSRSGTPFLLHLAGRLGNAQIGPIYLGVLGTMSLMFGLFAFTIIGMNMLASVNWDPVQFIRQLFWLSLDPPAPGNGLKFAPLNQGGWWQICGLFLTISVLLWWANVSPRTRAANGYAYRVGVCCCDLVVPGARSVPSGADG
jgi:photosynthetic reaction center M subunit